MYTLIFTTMNSFCSLYLQGREGGHKNHVLGLLQTAALLTHQIQLLNKVRRLKWIKCGRPIRCGTFVALRADSYKKNTHLPDFFQHWQLSFAQWLVLLTVMATWPPMHRYATWYCQVVPTCRVRYLLPPCTKWVRCWMWRLRCVITIKACPRWTTKTESKSR